MRNLYYCFLVLMLSMGAQAQCVVNGSFETTPSQYSFKNRSTQFQITDCEVNTSDAAFTTYTLPAGSNLFTADASWVSSGSDTFLLACNPSVTMSRVKPGAGNRAMRLNNFEGTSDVTTMSQTFTATGTEISFSYSLIIENPHPEEMDRQPFFSVRVYDMAGNKISTNNFCIVADPVNTIFGVTSWLNPAENEIQDVLYTGWKCGLVTIPDEFLSQSVRLEFVMGDCGKSAHFGTVYIDDITCSAACTQPSFGYLALDDASFNCPKEPFQVCGTYIVPEGTTLNSWYVGLQVWKDGVYVDTVSGAATSFTSNSFCFTVNPSTDFGTSPSGEYEFKVSASFFNGTTYVLTLTDTSSSIGPDVTIGNVDITGAYVQGSTLIWPDVADVYELEFFTDGSCCPGSTTTQPAYFHFTQSENTFNLTQIASSTPGARAMVYGCFRYRIKTDCGWSAWCCIAIQNGQYEFPEGASWGNPLAPDCYEGAAGSCLSTLTLTVSNPVITNTLSYQQRDQWIKASNTVQQDATAIYQAGNFIELQPGFNAQYTSVFQATIENCVYGASAPQPKPQAKAQDLSGEDYKNASKKNNAFVVYPNPFVDTITIVDENIFTTVSLFTIIDITGKEVIRVNNPDGLKEIQINVSSLNAGIYFVTGDGETLQKIIKN